MRSSLLIILLFLSLIIVSCTVETKKVAETNKPELDKPELDKEISSARDLTGKWAGLSTYQNNVANPNCIYEGIFDFNFQQNNNELRGSYVLTITKSTKKLQTSLPCSPEGKYVPTNIEGTISSSSIKFSDGFADYSGTFTNNLMNLDFESCPNNTCSDGSLGIGLKGNIKLNRK